jgi:predicted enzyme related to lactoylglutathione lyase
MSGTDGVRRFEIEGHICWHELHSSEASSVESFYSRLLGWSFADPAEGLGGFRKTIHHGSRLIGYLVDLDDEMPGGSSWLPFMNVSDVDNVLNDVTRLGGSIVLPPTERHGMGIRAVAADTSGALVGMISGVSSAEPLPESMPSPGEFVWNDLLSRSPVEAGGFYGGLTGLQLFSMDLGDEGTYYLLRRGEINEAGIILKPEKAEGDSSWLCYVGVQKIEEACVAAGHYGGAIHIPPRDLHGAGKYAVVGDPAGATFALFEPAV